MFYNRRGGQSLVLSELCWRQEKLLESTIMTICKEPCDQPIPKAKSTPCQPRASIAQKKMSFSQPNLHADPHTMKWYSQQISYIIEKSRWGTVSSNTPADNQGSQLLRAVFLKNAFLTPTSFISESEISLSFQTYLKHILKAALNRHLGTCETWRCIWGFNS